MIARHWRGWTEVHNANAYEAFLKTRVLPEARAVVNRTPWPRSTRIGNILLAFLSIPKRSG